MKNVLLSIVMISFLGGLYAQSTMNLTANFETIGVTVLLGSDDPQLDAYATLEYRESSSDIWREGLPLSRVHNELQMCSGTIFWLSTNTTYNVKVTVVDPTTSTLDGNVIEGSISTRSYPEFGSGTGSTIHVTVDGAGETYTLQEGINLAVAGDEVVLAEGSYFVGNIVFPNNGNTDNPIEIRGVDKDKVILNGAYETPLVWSPYGAGGVYQTTTTAINPNLIIADGTRLYPHQTFPDLQGNKITLSYLPIVREYPAEVGGFYRNPTLLPWINFGDPVGIATNKLYIRLLDGANPNEKEVEVTKQATCLKFNNNQHIVIKDMTIKNYGLGNVATAVICSNSSDIVFDGCLFKANNSSIRLNLLSTNILIQHCEFEDYFFNWNAWKIKATQDFDAPFNARFPNLSRNLEKGSLIFGHDFIGNSIVFRRNIVKNYHQGGQLSPAPPSASELDNMRKSLDIDFYENTIRNCRGDGFEIDGYARNIRVFNNLFEEVHAPLSTAVAEEGPLYIIRNVFANLIEDASDNGFDLLVTNGHTMKFQGGYNWQKNGDVFFYHNTVDAQNEGVAMDVYHLIIADAWTKLDSKNNILVTDEGISLRVRTIAENPKFFSDYNAYFSNNTAISSITFDNSTPDLYANISEVATKYGWDDNSLQVDPEFVDAGTLNYHLEGTSKAIDGGVVIPGINEEAYGGVGPDIGAFESDFTSTITFEADQYVKLYPNPTTGFLSVKIDSQIQDWSYSVVDLVGTVVQEGRLYSLESQLDVTDLQNGAYNLQLTNEDDLINIRFVKISN